MSYPARIIKLYRHSPREEVKLFPCYMHAMGWRQYKPNFRNLRTKGQYYDYQIQYVMCGKGYLEWENKVHALEQGDVFFIDLAQPSHYYADDKDPWEAVWVHFGGNQAGFYYKLFGKSSPVLKLSNAESVSSRLLQMFEWFDQPNAGADLLAASRLVEIMTELIVDRMNKGDSVLSKRPQQNGTVTKAMTYIEQMCSSLITIDEIAAHVSINPDYFSRLFSAISGYTIKEFIIRQRIRKAKDMLMNTEASLPEIAGACGFSDQSHMGKMFRKYEKTTPRKYRNWAFGR